VTTKVLYVEHDDDNLYMLKTRLERCGDFKVLAAEDTEQGCKLAVTENPDVILMDLEMPVMDRWEAVRTLKKDPRTRNIPIIGMSAYAETSEREKAMATGCDEFDAKPIEFQSLVATVRRVLAKPNRCSANEANRGDFAAPAHVGCWHNPEALGCANRFR
jgi:two-component system cell cycle response regulator DivK